MTLNPTLFWLSFTAPFAGAFALWALARLPRGVSWRLCLVAATVWLALL